jgi:lysozyme family protein
MMLKSEGGYVNHKSDRGGATNYGVTQATYSRWLKAVGLPDRAVKEIQQHEVEAIYSSYWKDAHCSYLPDGLDLLVFDLAFNSCAGLAIRTLQYVLGVNVDGVCGRQTMDAVHQEMVTGGVDKLCEDYLAAREDFYHSLVERDPRQQAFIKGWLNRLDSLREALA